MSRQSVCNLALGLAAISWAPPFCMVPIAGGTWRFWLRHQDAWPNGLLHGLRTMALADQPFAQKIPPTSCRSHSAGQGCVSDQSRSMACAVLLVLVCVPLLPLCHRFLGIPKRWMGLYKICAVASLLSKQPFPPSLSTTHLPPAAILWQHYPCLPIVLRAAFQYGHDVFARHPEKPLSGEG